MRMWSTALLNIFRIIFEYHQFGLAAENSIAFTMPMSLLEEWNENLIAIILRHNSIFAVIRQ